MGVRREGALTALRYLVEVAGADVRALSRRGHQPIHVAARAPRTDNVKRRFEVGVGQRLRGGA